MGHRLNLAFVILALATLLPAQESSAQVTYPAAYNGAVLDQGFGLPGAGYGFAAPGYYPFRRGYSIVTPPWAGSQYQTGPGSLHYSPSSRVYDSGSYTHPNGLGGHDTVRTTGYDTKRSYIGYGAAPFGVASMPGGYYGTGGSYGAGVAPGLGGSYGAGGPYGAGVAPVLAGYLAGAEPNFGPEQAYTQALAY